jgi:thiol-disulfide isomerase/thioredoxin
MSPMKRHAIALAVLLALTAAAAGAEEKAADFTFEDINPASSTHGQEITLSEEYADEGVLINFLASWCNPCWQELPILQAMANAGYMKVLGMAADEYGAGPEGVLIMAKRKGLTLPILWVDAEQAVELEKRYTYQMLPSLYFIRSDGTIASLIEGAVSPERIHKEIARAFHPSD